MDWGIVGLWFLTVPSLTHLVNKDVATDRLRQWAYNRSNGAESMLTYFLECPWCVSFWVAAATAPAVIEMADWTWGLYPFLVLAARYITGRLEGGPPDQIEIITED